MTRRLEELPKTARTELARLEKISYSKLLNFNDVVQQNIRPFRPGAVPNTNSCSSAWYGFIDVGILNRLRNDDIRSEVVGLNTAARFKALLYQIDPNYAGDYDCMHINGILLSLATNDTNAADLCIQRYPGPAKSGHAGTVLLTNAVYTVYMRREEMFSEMSKKLFKATESKYWVAMFRCLAGIMTADKELVATSLNEMLALHYRQKDSSMLKFHCTRAHAFYNVWRNLYDGESLKLNNEAMMWDSEFDQYVNDKNTDHGEYFDFSTINPPLARCIADLPDTKTIREVWSRASEAHTEVV